MTSTVVSLRLSSEAILAIDGLVGARGRSEFIRRAVLTALGDEALAFADGPAPERVRVEVSVAEVKSKSVAEEVLERIEVRSAAAARDVVLPKVAPKPGGSIEHRFASDGTVLMMALRSRRMTVREAVAELGWNAMRVEAAAKALGGLIALKAGGVMELVDE
jgi:hypothetical protein